MLHVACDRCAWLEALTACGLQIVHSAHMLHARLAGWWAVVLFAELRALRPGWDNVVAQSPLAADLSLVPFQKLIQGLVYTGICCWYPVCHP